MPFGSTNTNFKSSGVLRNSIDITMTFIITDLPDPVVPAIKRCGKSARLSTTGLPVIFRPTANSSGEVCSAHSLLSRIMRKLTLCADLFGISTPTYGCPGIGASIRTLSTARLRANSLSRLAKRDIGMPRCGSMQYCVTRGPTLTLRTEPPRPNSLSVLSICCARLLTSPGLAPWRESDSSVTFGNCQLELLIGVDTGVATAAFSILLAEFTSMGSCGLSRTSPSSPLSFLLSSPSP